MEDSVAVRKIAAKSHEHHGYRLTVAVDSGDAMRIFKQNPNDFDLVAIHVAMRKMDRCALAEALRRLRSGLPVLFESGYTETATVHPSGRDAQTSFLARPFTPESLARAVRGLLTH